MVARLRPTVDAVLCGTEVRLRQGEMVVAAPLPLADASPEGAGRGVASLLALLDASTRPIGGVRLVVSDLWLRPLVFPLGAQVLGDDELDLVIAHQYAQIYGKLMSGWGWRWDRQPNGLVVAMAWPDSLLALRPLLAERGIRLVSALPQSLSAIRGLAMPPEPAWFVLVAARCVSFVRIDAQGWRQWRVVAAVEASADFVASELMRRVAQLDDDCRCVRVLAPSVSPSWQADLRGLLAQSRWRVLPGETEN